MRSSAAPMQEIIKFSVTPFETGTTYQTLNAVGLKFSIFNKNTCLLICNPKAISYLSCNINNFTTLHTLLPPSGSNFTSFDTSVIFNFFNFIFLIFIYPCFSVIENI